MPIPIPLFELRRRAKFFSSSLPVAAQAPYVATGYTEFYCQSGGSNVNSGTTQDDNPSYATTGNWVSASRTFTVTDGTNPASLIKVGELVSVATSVATSSPYIARATSVDNAVNGNVVLSSTVSSGISPADGTGNRTLRLGGAWKGPNGSDVYPFTGVNFANVTNLRGEVVRINFKNDATYSISSSLGSAVGTTVLQGYSMVPGDGGRAIFDGGTNAISIWNPAGGGGGLVIDFILKSSATAGSSGVFINLPVGMRLIRVTAMGGRGIGFGGNTGVKFFECEAYNNAGAGFSASASQLSYFRCISAGNKSDGFNLTAASAIRFIQCIAHSNSRDGISITANSNDIFEINSCDLYNNGRDGIFNGNTTGRIDSWIENCNFIKNGRYGISGSLTTGVWMGFIYNCGFGEGSAKNSLGHASNIGNLQIVNPVQYENDITPYNNPSDGDFSLVATSTTRHLGAGRGLFIESQGGFSGTLGYPDLGAAQHAEGAITPQWRDANIILPDAYVSHSYAVDWTFSSAVTLSVISGSLPPGLSLSTVSATEAHITGTPTGVIGSTYTFTLRATSGALTQDAIFQITVQDDPDQGSAFAGGF